MPHEYTLLTAEPIEPDVLLGAVRSVVPRARLRMIADAAAQILDEEHRVVLTAVRPRRVAVPDEVARLLDAEWSGSEAPYWTDVVVATSYPGAVAAALVEALAARTGASLN